MARSLNHFAVETTLNSVCVIVVVELRCTSTIQKYSVLRNNAFMVNLCHRQQCKLNLLVFETNYVSTSLCSFQGLRTVQMLHWNKVTFFAQGLLYTFNMAKQIVNKSLCTFSVFISLVTILDGINNLWSNKYYIFWVCVCSLSCPVRNAHARYHIFICDLSGFTIFFHITS